MLVPKTTKKIQVICPICHTMDIVGIPEQRLDNSSRLITISIQKGLICPHHFQFFLDRNLKIRGYQKVDFELTNKNSIRLRNGIKAFKGIDKKNGRHFKNIILEGKKVSTPYLRNEKIEHSSELKKALLPKNRRLVLKDIYEEFWEFIDDNNERFQEFIIKDKRRKNLKNQNS